MTETGFGPGGYSYTEAAIPAAPALAIQSSVSAIITPGNDTNPDYTVYAIYNETDSEYLDASGAGSQSPVWQTKSEWGTITDLGLTPVTDYTFKIKARNGDGVETDFGPSALCTTYGQGIDTFDAALEIRKASSTISAPDFMSGLTASIRIAGKSLHDFGFHVDKVSGLDLPRAVADEELVPGAHSWLVHDEYFAPKQIVLEGFVHGSTPEDLRLRLAYLKSFLATFEGNPWRSKAPVALERSDLPDRHWMVYYDAVETLETLGKRDLSTTARIKVAMKCPVPYALSNEVVRLIFTAAAGTFTPVDLGNAPSDAVYVIKGSSTNPEFTVGDMVFFCDFSDGLSFTEVSNVSSDGVYSPAQNEAGAYRTTETGVGVLVNDTDAVTYTATGNAVDGSWVFVVAPEWQSTSETSDVTIFEHYADADNYIRLYWDGSAQAWVFRKCADGTVSEVSTAAQAFTAKTRIIIGLTYDSTNAGGMKLYVNGVQAGLGANTDSLDAAPDTVTLHNNDGSGQSDAVYDLAVGWSRMLSADEMLKIATNPGAVSNLNCTVSYTGTLDSGDMLSIDSELKTAGLFDVSTGVRSNALGAVSGTIPVLTPGRRRTATDRTQTVVYVKNAAAQMEVRYRRRYL